MNKLSFLLVTTALCSSSWAQEPNKEHVAAAHPAFVEKSRIEITQNADRSLNFKNTGSNSSPGVMIIMPLESLGSGHGSPRFGGFYAGTLVVVGDTGYITKIVVDRSEYTIDCTYSIQKGTTIEIRTEGKIVPNLKFVRDGRVVADFTVKNSDGKVIMSNQRKIDFVGGRVTRVFFEDETKAKELTSTGGKIVDLRTTLFDLK